MNIFCTKKPQEENFNLRFRILILKQTYFNAFKTSS